MMITKNDRSLWAWVLQSVRPLAGRVVEAMDFPSHWTSVATTTPPPVLKPSAVEPLIDLHGHTIADAHATVLGFLERCRQAGHRSAVVITGKSGEIRREFPLWCDTQPFRRHVRSVRACSRSQGGAYEVTLVK